jgi:ABC-2 type transport system permease protein
MTLVSTVAIFCFGVLLRGSIPAWLLAAGLFIVAGLSLGLFISTISNTQQDAFLSTFLFLLPAINLPGPTNLFRPRLPGPNPVQRGGWVA